MKSLKILLIACFCIIANVYAGNILNSVLSLIELFLIFYISTIIYNRHSVTGYWLNSLLCLLFLSQMGVLMFSGEWISLLMLENMNVVGDLGDKLPFYIMAALAVSVLAFLPFGPLQKKNYTVFLSGGGIIAYLIISVVGFAVYDEAYSPYTATVKTIAGSCTSAIEHHRIKKNRTKEDIFNSFHKDGIALTDGIKYPVEIKGKPDIIVFFTEGMSAEVIDVFNDLNLGLTPNLDSLYGKSLVFTNYFNHTAATFRALKGQLYSLYMERGGYGKDGVCNYDTDDETLKSMVITRQVSLTDILKAEGYHTTFVNSEPGPFLHYLETFGFDKVVPGRELQTQLSDKEVFNVLYDTIKNTASPSFTAFYNLGTHHGFDSQDVRYRDGKNPVLNKFHNFDYQIGEFLKKMKNEKLLDNTIVIFTSDHATYNAPEFKAAFSSSQNSFFAPIPFFIWWDGIEHDVIDVSGRNSLDFAPTVLDILGISDYENYFLGESLFSNEKHFYSGYGALGYEFYYTKEGEEAKKIKYSRHHHVLSKIRECYIISQN